LKRLQYSVTMTKVAYIFSKEPCILLKEPYTMAQEPYILSKEPYFIPRTVMRQYHDKRSLEILKRALWNDKKAVYLPKTTQYHDKHTPSRLARALYNGKKAPYPPSQKSPISCIRAVYHTLNKLRCAKTIEVETWRALLSAYNIISKEPCIMAKEPHILYFVTGQNKNKIEDTGQNKIEETKGPLFCFALYPLFCFCFALYGTFARP